MATTNIPISATTTDFIGAIDAARAAVNSFDKDLNSKLVTSFRALDREQRVFAQGLGRVQAQLAAQATEAARSAAAAQAAAAKRIADIGQGFKSVGQGLTTYVTLPLLAAGAAAFKVYSDIDALKRALGAVATQTDTANNQFERLRDIAKLPGVGLEEAVQGSVRLQAVGFSAKAAEAAIRQFGNAIALTGGGKAELTTITTQLGQMAAKGKVLAQDLKPVIEAAPAAARVIKGLFGTVDSEEISAKLKAQGKDSAFFIDLLTSELSKLERVSGGPKNALENLADSLKIASYNFVSVADNALGLTDKLNGLGDFITKAATGFSALAPGTQTAILGVIGLAAAIGPLSLAIGGIISLLPTLSVGFAAVTGPIGLAVAAVVAAATLIITNWDSVKAVLVDTGIWDTITETFRAGLELVKAVFATVVAYLKSVWADLKDFVIPTARFLFDTLAAIFRAAAGVLGGTFKILTGILTLNWKTFTDGLQNITASVFNLIKTAFVNTFVFLGRAVSGLLSKLGREGNAYFLNQYLDDVQANAGKAAIALRGVKKEQEGITLNEVTVKAKRTVVGSATSLNFTGAVPGKAKAERTINPKDYGDLAILKRFASELETQIQNAGGAAPQKLIQQLEDVRHAIESIQALTGKNKDTPLPGLKEITNPGFKGTLQGILENVLAIADATPGIFKKAGADIFLTATEKARPGLEFFRSKMEELSTTIGDAAVKLQGFAVPQRAIDSLVLYTKEIQKAERAQQQARDLADIAANPSSESGKGPFAGIFSSGTVGIEAVQNMMTKFGGAKDAITTSVRQIADAMAAGREQLKGAAVGLLSSFGEAIGQNKNPLKAALGLILGLLSGFIIQLGTALLLSSAALLAAAPLTFGITLAPGIGQQLAGAGLIVAGAAVKGFALKGFAKGGVFDQPSVGLFGEYAGATRNREIATPENLMRSIFKSELNNQGFQQLRNSSQNRPQSIAFPEYIPVSSLEGSTLKTMLRRADVTSSTFGTKR